MGKDNLTRLRVLVIEDKSMVSMLIEDMLEEMDCIVAGLASELGEALALARSLQFDAAILDVNLNGFTSFSIAKTLQEEKGIPFIFATGYGAAAIPEMFSQVPVLAKPFLSSQLRKALAAAVAQASAK